MEKLELIKSITSIIKEYGSFGVEEMEEETNGVVVSELGKFVGIAEYFDEDYSDIAIYEPISFSSDEIDYFEMKYDEMDENVLQNILLICKKWEDMYNINK